MNFITIQPAGILDSVSANQLRCSVNAAMESGAETILIDFQDVTFMNSSAIGALVATLKAVKSQGKKLSISSLNPQLKMIFELTRMEDLFEIYCDRNTFEQAHIAALSSK
ncbi:MAG: STAS domain-containing protein [Thermosynechococcaceae cyanobacterium]